MNLVMSVSDKVVALDFGRKIAEGTPAEVQRNEAVIRAYLGNPQDAAALTGRRRVRRERSQSRSWRFRPGVVRAIFVSLPRPRTRPMMLEVRGLCAFYGQSQALYGLDFALEEGAIVTLLGANGAGKTTTLRALCGMVRMTGDIRFDGKPIAGRATEDIVRLGIAHVPEGRGTFVRMTVEENLQLGAMSRRDHAAIAADIDEIYGAVPAARGAARGSRPAP